MSTYLNCDGTDDYATSDLTTAITGDLDVRARIRATDWTPGVFSICIAQQWGWLKKNWSFHLLGSGRLYLYLSADGSAQTAIQSTATLGSAVTLVDNVTDLRVRGVHDVNNGAAGNDVLFYWSLVGGTWTKLGNTITTAGTLTRYNSTAAHQASCDNPSWNGRIYSATILSGIDGTTVAAPDFSASPWDVGETVNVDAQGNTWTLTNAVIRSDQTATLDPAVRVRTAGDLTVTPGICAVTLDAAHRIRTANDLTIGQGTAAMLHPIRASGRYKQNRARIRIYP